MTLRAKTFISIVVAAGLFTAIWSLRNLQFHDETQFLTYLVLALASARFAVSLPTVPGTLSAVFLFHLLSIIELSLGETILMVCLTSAAQNYLNSKNGLAPVKIIFSIHAQVLAVFCAYMIFHACTDHLGPWGMLTGLLAASFSTYLLNSSMVASVVAFVEGSSPYTVWKNNFAWSVAYYLAGGGLAGLIGVASSRIGWQTSLLLLPVMYLFYKSFTTYMGRLNDAKLHAEEVSALHLRTIESLALAIEAKDDTTHAHLRRVQTYAVALGEEIGLVGKDIDALRAAAILHDIGKLAVPEHIICKPGKLTPEEFERMKIHPVVGAEILEHVKFPYPVAPIVLSHHEKWNGTGYPYGKKGEEIPIGARILAAVDCLDALASDRQYRKALPLPEAMQVVIAESGKSFDPKIVELLKHRYVDLEKAAQHACADLVKLSTNLKIDRGDAPAAGFEKSAEKSKEAAGGHTLVQAVAIARSEIQTIFELPAGVEGRLSLNEILSLVMSRFKPLIPQEAMVIWIRHGSHLRPLHVEGANAALFRSLHIPLGEGLAGWVCQNEKPIMNGNPAVEPGYLNDPSKFTTLRSAIAVPLMGIDSFSGVLAFYTAERDGYQKDHLRMLQAVSAKLATSIERSLSRQNTIPADAVDSLTGLPTLAGMMDRGEQELARARRVNGNLAVVVCDMDNLRGWNDKYGHHITDRILQDFALGLRNMFRNYDLVARIGGDEFAVVIPDISTAGLAARIDEIHVLARECGLRAAASSEFAVTAGSACFPGDAETVEDLLNAADRRVSVEKASKAKKAIKDVPRHAPRPAAAVETAMLAS